MTEADHIAAGTLNPRLPNTVIVGRLVSITMGAGHLCADLMRITDLSTRASRKKFWEEAFGKYQSEMNSIPRSRLPTKKEVAT
jgi:hypothetical protein